MKLVLVTLALMMNTAYAQTTPAAAAGSEPAGTLATSSAQAKAASSRKSTRSSKAKGIRMQSAQSQVTVGSSPSQASSVSGVSLDRAQAQKESQSANATEIRSADGTINQSTVKLTTEAKPASKWTGSLAIGAFTAAKDLKENGSNAMIDSVNLLEVFYSATDRLKVGLGHHFGLRAVGDRAQMADYESDNGLGSMYKTYDPALHVSYQMPSFYGSSAYKIISRFYVPVSEDARAKKINGMFRMQAFITWVMNPRVDISFNGQARLHLNSKSNPDEQLGSDSVLRTIVGPAIGYNFSSVWNVYYNPYFDIKSANFQRGQFDSDMQNRITHEAGLWVSIPGGVFIVNPAYVTTSNKSGRSSYEGFGTLENTDYNLNLIASF